jgi:hypothetical protein
MRASGSDRAAGNLGLSAARKAPEDVRHRNEPTVPEWTDVSGGVDDRAHPAEPVYDRATSQPNEALRPHEYLNPSTGLLDQRGGFEGALATADHRDLLVTEVVEPAVLTGVGYKIGRQVCELCGSPCKGRDPACHDDATCVQLLAVDEDESKNPAVTFDSRDETAVDIRDDAALHPIAILNEAFNGHGRGEAGASRAFEGVERQLAIEVGDIRCAPIRTEQHARWHRAPERHRLPENTDIGPCCTQMSRSCQPVRAGSNDGDIDG